MTENNQQETAYAKGENFEKLFAEFMKSDLGWNSYVIRSQQKGKANSKGSQVDIIGQRKDDTYRRLWNLGLLFALLFVGLFIIGIILLIDGDDTGTYLLISGLVLGGFSAFCFWDCEHYRKENAWVECKNRKTKSTFEDVRKSVEEYKDYKASRDKEYKYVVHYFVSANGFVENALKYAKDNGLICYEFKNGKFEEVHHLN